MIRSTVVAVLLAGSALAVGLRIRRRRTPADVMGCVALVTGASRGLGREVARELTDRGVHVVICARNGDQVLDAERELQESGGGEVRGEVCDVTDPRAVAELIDRVVRWRGRLDIVVANAGTLMVGPLSAQDTEEVQQASDVMLWGVWHAITAALPHLRESEIPRVTVVTSIGGKVPAPHLLAYSVAKHAAVGLSEGLRVELADEGIPVTTVVPGLMRTGSHLHARMRGRPGAEFRWFGLAAVVPGLSMRAERAARRVVEATIRGDAELILGAPAHVAVRAHGLAPGLGTRAAALVHRVLPRGADAPEHEGVRGVATEPGRGIVGAAGRPSARRHGQHTD
ncbi:SDR family NAD(P)-dependent oxidoreductase [Egibacter rhizosphaerae]|nr:SDR family NAD(P)-dependent oxidoreductase [Egibacter rhizosphaerae]